MDTNDNNEPDDNNEGEFGNKYAPLTLSPSSVFPEMWESVLSVETYLECGRYLVFHRVVAY
jgi:hypothetical protein